MDILDTRRQSVVGTALRGNRRIAALAAGVALIALVAGGVHAWKLARDQGPESDLRERYARALASGALVLYEVTPVGK